MPTRETIRFDEFELDLSRYELRREGQPVKLQKLPLRLLILLVEAKGRLVTRQQIADQLWGQDVFHDTEHGINTAIRKIRDALGDDPDRRKLGSAPVHGGSPGRPWRRSSFERADGSKGSAKAEAALASLLQQAGHSVSVSRTPEEVEKTVQARPVDLIILSAPDADVVEPLLRTLLVKPTLIPILYKPKKADMAATEQRYNWAVAAPASPGPLLATIDSAVQSRLSRDTRVRN